MSKVVNPGEVADGEIITTPFGTATFDAIAPVTPEQSAPMIAATPCEITPSASFHLIVNLSLKLL